jgi:bacteriorhodopsin
MTITIDDPEYETASKAAQLGSGILFAFFAVFLSWANSPGIEAVQKKPLLERLELVTSLCLFVTLFSSFFNFFQVTEYDNIVLDNRKVDFVLDIARPIEWIATCPIMQLALVVYGGTSIPAYRRIVMPLLSVCVLVLGTTAMLSQRPEFLRFVLAGIAFSIAMAMFTLNRIQIVEHSNGQEDLWRGSSDYWKVSTLLIATWFPFPIWFSLSPEGFGLVTDVLVVQLGWAFLNVFSKLTFMGFFQYVKWREQARSRNRVFESIMPAELVAGKPLNIAHRSEAGILQAVVIDALTTLGWAAKIERFTTLLKAANVKTCDDLAALSEEECAEKVLPWDMVCACQQRVRKYKIEETDACLDQLAQSEVMYGTAEGRAYIQKQKTLYELENTPSNAPGNYVQGGVLDIEYLIPQFAKVVENLVDRKMKAQEEILSQHSMETQREIKEMKHQIQLVENSVSSARLIDQVDARMAQVDRRMESMEKTISSLHMTHGNNSKITMADLPALQSEPLLAAASFENSSKDPWMPNMGRYNAEVREDTMQVSALQNGSAAAAQVFSGDFAIMDSYTGAATNESSAFASNNMPDSWTSNAANTMLGYGTSRSLSPARQQANMQSIRTQSSPRSAQADSSSQRPHTAHVMTGMSPSNGVLHGRRPRTADGMSSSLHGISFSNEAFQAQHQHPQSPEALHRMPTQ